MIEPNSAEWLERSHSAYQRLQAQRTQGLISLVTIQPKALPLGKSVQAARDSTATQVPKEKPMTLTWNIETTKFSAPIAASKLDKLAKRGFQGGLNYDLAEIPENVRLALLAKAVEEFLRSPLKNADKENITREAVVELMTNRLDLLKSGNIKAAAATGKRAPSLRTAARKRIRQMIKDQLDVDVSKEELDNAVKQVFEAYDTWNKKTTSAEDKAQLEPVANIVVQAMKDAEDDLKRQAKLAAGLSQLASMAKKSPAAPKAAPKAATPAGTGKKKKAASASPSA